MGWDANDSEARGKQPRNVFNKRRAAMVERVSVQSDYSISVPPELLPERRPTAEWFEMFQDAMTALIEPGGEGFVNHNVYDPSSSYPSIPMWTEEDMMGQIGAACRIPPPISEKTWTEWANQQYKMLNQLRYVVMMGPGIAATEQTGSNAHAVWGDAVAEYAAASWVEEAWPEVIYWTEIDGPPGEGYAIHGAWGKGTFNGPTEFDAAVDLWSKGNAYSPSMYRGGTYQPIGPYLTEDVLYRFKTIAEGSLTGIEIEPTTKAQLQGHSFIQPGGDGTWCCAGYYTGVVMKFDGPNGFTFKDW